jgi:hypothetical protein
MDRLIMAGLVLLLLAGGGLVSTNPPYWMGSGYDGRHGNHVDMNNDMGHGDCDFHSLCMEHMEYCLEHMEECSTREGAGRGMMGHC